MQYKFSIQAHMIEEAIYSSTSSIVTAASVRASPSLHQFVSLSLTHHPAMHMQLPVLPYLLGPSTGTLLSYLAGSVSGSLLCFPLYAVQRSAILQVLLPMMAVGYQRGVDSPCVQGTIGTLAQTPSLSACLSSLPALWDAHRFVTSHDKL